MEDISHYHVFLFGQCWSFALLFSHRCWCLNTHFALCIDCLAVFQPFLTHWVDSMTKYKWFIVLQHVSRPGVCVAITLTIMPPLSQPHKHEIRPVTSDQQCWKEKWMSSYAGLSCPSDHSKCFYTSFHIHTHFSDDAAVVNHLYFLWLNHDKLCCVHIYEYINSNLQIHLCFQPLNIHSVLCFSILVTQIITQA